MTITRTNPSSSSKALDDMYHSTAAQDPRLRATWADNLAAAFASEGLEHIETHKCKGSDHHSFAMHEYSLLKYETITRQSPRSEAEKISNPVPKAARETRDGAMIGFERLTVIGRKP